MQFIFEVNSKKYENWFTFANFIVEIKVTPFPGHGACTGYYCRSSSSSTNQNRHVGFQLERPQGSDLEKSAYKQFTLIVCTQHYIVSLKIFLQLSLNSLSHTNMKTTSKFTKNTIWKTNSVSFCLQSLSCKSYFGCKILLYITADW